MIRLRLGRKKVKKLQKVLRGVGCYLRLLMLGGVLAMAVPARADLPVSAKLPVPCGVGCAASGGPTSWVSDGRATLSSSTNALYVNQQTDKAILNWQSFNIANGYGVQFNQPGSDSIALNRIYQADPSRIQGSLTANGQVYLINRNGFVFGNGAKVDVNTLTVSTLNISDNVFNTGIMQALKDNKPAFEKDGPMGSVVIETGAELRSADGGRIMILAPRIENQGKIETPDGQTILAASQDKVWLQESDDKNLRGLLVEVGTGGNVRNLGEIIAKRGNITMMGFAVNQDGMVSATTTVNRNGSIKLLARDKGQLEPNSDVLGAVSTERYNEQTKEIDPAHVTFGIGSRTEVLPELDDMMTAVDEQKQPVSQVDVVAKEIVLRKDSEIVAPGGNVNFTATANPEAPAQKETLRNASRVILEEGSLIDVGGTTSTVLPMSRNALKLTLFSNELKDSPLQRNGILYRKEVTVDLRQGTKIADISGEIGKIERDVGERLAAGGTVNITSEGDVVMASDATVDISGGVVNYEAGWMNTTKLVSAGKIFDISDADPNLIYDSVLGKYTRKDAKWGMTQTWTIAGPIAQGYYEEAYTEGKSAGKFTVTTTGLRLDGKVVADVTRGKYQRDPSDPEHLPELGTLELDLAKLEKGSLNYDPATVKFAYASAEAYDPGKPLDPSAPITIDPRLLQEGGVGRLILKHQGAVNIPEGTAINLPAGGEFTVTGSEINVDGSITVASGKVSLNTVQTPYQAVANRPITLGEDGRIDVSGLWINDYALTNVAADVDPLFVDGGSVTLNAKGDLNLTLGSIIDADGGAYVDAKGKLHAGDGGDISLTVRDRDIEETAMMLDGEFHAYAIGKGGTLSIEANALRVGRSGSALAGELLLTPEFFQQGGFRKYALTANLDGVIVESGTVVRPQVQNLMLDGDYFGRATGAAMSGFTTRVTLPDDRRRPVDLSLSLNQMVAAGVRPAHFEIESGARIELEPEARLELTSDHSLDINGVLAAPAGRIDLKIDKYKNDAADPGYQPEQGIHLGSDAQLLANGTTKLIPNTLNQPLGQVLSGGRVTLTADRGHIVMEAGSVIDVSGTAAALLVREQGATDGTLQTIASDAGAIHLKAAEGMVLAGTLTGNAGGGAGAAGGELAVTMDANNRAPDVAPPPPYRDFSYTPSTIVLTEASIQLPADWQAGAVLPKTANGQAIVGTDSVENGGFDSLTLKAVDQTQRNGELVRGQINLEQADLELKRSVVLDASVINNKAGDSRIAAAYVAIANNNANGAVQPTPDNGAGKLEIAAQHIDLIGNVALQGWQQTQINSSGDIRLRGLLPDGSGKEWHGSLNSFGDLEFKAAQIYPATLTQFGVEVARPDGSLKISPAADKAPSPVLSAGGKLTLKADNIYQGGIVKAPVGEIEIIAADTLVLAKGSVTSTSAENQIIPFGRTDMGLDWIYPTDVLDGNKPILVYGVNAQLPAQNLKFNSASVVQETGAVIDVSGGGDLYAYEFVEGIGGSRDVLAPKNAVNSYAILPWLSGYGPYDPLEFTGTDLTPGDSIHLAAGSALPEGDYLLLPARYALLPGAYLVTKQAGTQDFGPGFSVTKTDGSVLIGGYRTVAGTDIREARWSGYTVAPGDIARTRSEYQNSFANEFFARRALAAEQAAPLLPKDAGHLSIGVTKALQLDGELLAQAERGRGARVDLEAAKLTIVAQRGADDGTVQVTAANLNALGAESMLLGGHRTESGDVTALTTTSTKVVVKSGAKVDVPELLLAATDEVKVESGAELAASGEGASSGVNYTLQGDGALLQVSAGAPSGVQRTYAQGVKEGVKGDLRVEAGAILTASQSMFLESSRNTIINGALNMQGGNLSLGAKHISLGEVPEGASGLVLTENQLNGLDVDYLTLTSRETVDVYGDVDLNTKKLTLAAAGLVGYGTDATTARITTDSLELKNINSKNNGTVTDAGRLVVVTEDLLLGEGKFKIDGFSATDIVANRQVRVAGSVDRSKNGDKTLNVDGDLTLRTPLITADSGSDTAIAASGKLEVLASSSAQEATSSGLGARLSFEGSDVTFGTSVQLHSGDIRLQANAGDVHLLSGAAIDVSGRNEEFTYKTVATPAGSVTLRSDNANVIVDDGASIALKSVGGADAGTLNVSAKAGELILDGAVDARDENGGGEGIAKLDVGTVSNFSALNRSLNDSGFGGKRELRQRQGDMVIAEDDAVNAKQVHFTADDGAIEMRGRINAAAEEGGKVILQAKDDVHLHSTARIDARATGADEAGGYVMLATTEGEIAVDAANDVDAAVIDVSGTRFGENADLQYVGGKVELRVPRVGNGVAVRSLAGKIRGAESISVEAFKTYQASTLDSSLQNQVLADTSDYMANAAAIAANLNLTGDPRFHLRPGVEIRSTGDLTVRELWDFASRDFDGNQLWRYGGEGGHVTLRAKGNLIFEQAVKDGIESDINGVPGRLLTGDSWSISAAGGADLDSADLLAVTAGQGGITVGAAVQVHTGSGDIQIASGKNLEFLDSTAAIFSAGRSGGYGSLTEQFVNYNFPGVFPVRGGNVTLNVTGDIIGAGTNQLISHWLYRFGNYGDGGTIPTVWAANFVDIMSGEPLFKQNLGVFGGGALTVDAGGDIKDMSAVAPSTGRPDGEFDGTLEEGFTSTNKVTVLGGGDMNITAGGDIKGGIFYVDGGVGKIKAGDNLLADDKDMAPVLALGDARFEVQTRNDLALETVLNPTVLPISVTGANIWEGTRSFFFSYGEKSGVDLMSVAGDVVLRNKTAALTADNFPGLEDVTTGLMTVYPGTLNAAALQGDILIDGSFKLFPSPQGDFSLLADGDVATSGTENIIINMSDADPALLPGIENPAQNRLAEIPLLLEPGGSPALIHAAVPVHVNDRQLVIIEARNGNLQGSSNGKYLAFHLPKQARLVAGKDIRDINFSGQNLTAADLTQFIAGRDIAYSIVRDPTGRRPPSEPGIILAGPGELELVAGRDIDLATSRGVETIGNSIIKNPLVGNPGLAESGASITVEAGISKPLDFAAYLEHYVPLDTVLTGEVAAAVRSTTGRQDLSDDEALAALDTLPRQDQRKITLRHFYAELSKSAAEASSGKGTGYQRGYDAIATLFGETDYQGDVRLYLSRIHTSDGGDINMLVPGGLINAGLAAVEGLNKKPGELGIVAKTSGDVNIYLDKDLMVNQSRVFALDGGDIMIWSQHGNIDAGRGAKSALSNPETTTTTDIDGNVKTELSAAIAGSGIRTAAGSPGTEPGGVTLAAPQGAVIANDAGIESAGRLTLAATEVLGADNISAGGEAVGVPNIEPPSVSAEVGNAGNDAANAGKGDQDLAAASTTPLADAALAFLEVDVLGFGTESATDFAGVGDETEKVRAVAKGEPLKKNSDDVLPEVAESAEPAGQVAATPP